VNPHTDDDMTTPSTLRVLASWPDRVAALKAYTPDHVAKTAGLSRHTVDAYRFGKRPVPLAVLNKLLPGTTPTVAIVEACGMVLMVEAVPHVGGEQ
jgi:hypothetical protein